MIKKIIPLAFFLLTGYCIVQAQVPTALQDAKSHIDTLVYYLHHPKMGKPLVASHRGDWRNAPENSLQALHNSIAQGVDIIEIDLKRSKDGHLILMHDQTIDRTLTGKGKPSDYTLAELKAMRMRAGHGVPTEHIVPTFKEFLKQAKGKILIDVDKGYAYFAQVIQELKATNTLEQAIVNIDDNTSYSQVVTRYGKIPKEVNIMPVLAYKEPIKAAETLKSYLQSGHSNVIFQPVWTHDEEINTEEWKSLINKGYHIWINSLWSSLCGGHHDDRAVERNEKEATWGWLITHSGTIIQTDRPVQMLQYLHR